MDFHAGRACRVALAQRGKTRGWLADQLGVSPQRASNIINKESASLGTLKQMAEVFGLELSEYVKLGEFEIDQE